MVRGKKRESQGKKKTLGRTTLEGGIQEEGGKKSENQKIEFVGPLTLKKRSRGSGGGKRGVMETVNLTAAREILRKEEANKTSAKVLRISAREKKKGQGLSKKNKKLLNSSNHSRENPKRQKK